MVRVQQHGGMAAYQQHSQNRWATQSALFSLWSDGGNMVRVQQHGGMAAY